MASSNTKTAVHYNLVAEHHDYNHKSVAQIKRSISTLQLDYRIKGVPPWAAVVTAGNAFDMDKT